MAFGQPRFYHEPMLILSRVAWLMVSPVLHLFTFRCLMAALPGIAAFYSVNRLSIWFTLQVLTTTRVTQSVRSVAKS